MAARPTPEPAALSAEAARATYVDSCKELMSAIGTLESSLTSFVGKDEGIKGQVMAQTRARLEQELEAAPPPASFR